LQTIRVMTWNLWGRHGDWRSRQEVITQALRYINADIIGLQEVWADGSAANQGQLIANSLQFDLHFEPSRESQPTSIGNAIMSRWPMRRKGQMTLPAEAENAEPRIAVYAHVDSPLGSIPVVTTHLAWRRNASHLRQRQVAAIQQLASDITSNEWPPILLGDFNADPFSDEIRILTGQRAVPADCMVFQDAWVHGGNVSAGHTWTPDNSNFVLSHSARLTAMPWLRRRIDYIFVGLPDGRFEHVAPVQVERAWLDGRGANGGPDGSDHFAVVADCSLLLRKDEMD
jgi:endonuclease/exonuclease/phosphatase family metal-dependent hydrolase